MKRHLNTLFVTSPGAYLAKDGEAVAVRVDKQVRLRAPIINLGGIVCFGGIGVSPALMRLCAEAGVALTFLTQTGRFMARVTGFTPGNVLLRRAQFRIADDPAGSLSIAKPIVLAKVTNCRLLLLRGLRDYPKLRDAEAVRRTADYLKATVTDVETCKDLDRLRGLEGDAAKRYFDVFDRLITVAGTDFYMRGRTRRPPLDRVNALLSFLYAILTHDARAACEAVGLDAAVGFLHRDRPGRPGLALDLIEEFRPILADRVALTLINRRQLSARSFQVRESGAVQLEDEARKAVLVGFQKRKQETLMHPYLRETTTYGLLVHLQARLLARFLRGDLDGYPPYFAR